MYIDRHISCCIPSVINYRCELYMHHVSLLALCIYCYYALWHRLEVCFGHNAQLLFEMKDGQVP